jgi:arsenite methyltransferase
MSCCGQKDVGEKGNLKNTIELVREGYAEIARNASSCCSTNSCCSTTTNSADVLAQKLGYNNDEIIGNLGLSCGNPTALASLKPGEVVLDLGSGGGLDCFNASKAVGKTGKVIGIDMTKEMISIAEKNAIKHQERTGLSNVEFKLAEIEKLPIQDDSIDCIISNCVINLSTDKQSVFHEAHRVLKSGGRMHVSDICLLKPLPPSVVTNISAYIGCISGSISINDYIACCVAAGFPKDTIEYKLKPAYVEALLDGNAPWLDNLDDNVDKCISSVDFTIRKP